MEIKQFWSRAPWVHLAVIMPRSSRRGLSFHRHHHPFHEIGFLLEGECDWHLPDRIETLNAGDLLIVPAGVAHYEKTPARQQARIAWIGFDFTDDEQTIPPALSRSLAGGVYFDELRRLFNVVAIERQAQALAHEERALLALREILILICRLATDDGSTHSPVLRSKADRTAQLVRSAALTLSGNLSQPIRIRDLAHYHSLSTTHFATLFRRHQGVSPSRYLQNARIDRAKDLLAEGTLTTKEIAAICGYVDAAHFCHAFKSATKQTPKQWRPPQPD